MTSVNAGVRCFLKNFADERGHMLDQALVEGRGTNTLLFNVSLSFSSSSTIYSAREHIIPSLIRICCRGCSCQDPLYPSDWDRKKRCSYLTIASTSQTPDLNSWHVSHENCARWSSQGSVLALYATDPYRFESGRRRKIIFRGSVLIFSSPDPVFALHSPVLDWGKSIEIEDIHGSCYALIHHHSVD